MTQTNTTPVESATSSDDDNLDHHYCCDEFLALCGADLTNAAEVADMDNECVVCADLVEIDWPCSLACSS